MTSDRPTVLILASDPAFSREITADWPQGPAPDSDRPEFIVLDQDSSRDLESSPFDLAIADASSVGDNSSHDNRANTNKDKLPGPALKRALVAAGKPTILIHSDPALAFYNFDGSVLELRRDPGVWAAMAGLLGCEILQVRQAESRVREAEKMCAAAQADATLGRYMLEMRTNVNNALTTVLGNAELLVLEPGLPASVLAQADTIRNMALRLHEVFQRFSSIEKELTVAARESSKALAHTAAG